MFLAIRRSLCDVQRLQSQINYLEKAFHTTSTARYPPSNENGAPKVAVVLSGCGVYDGSEIHESSAVLVHLSRHGADISMFAPDTDQMHTINHTKGEPMEPNRNVLVESARIARGKIEPLEDLQATNFDAVIFPGGFGAAKNLCKKAGFHRNRSNFAAEGTMMKVLPDVERVIKDFHGSKKPIGLCCIAPVLAARVIEGCEVTVGQDKDDGGKWPYADTAEAIKAMDAKHILKEVTESHTDTQNKIVTSPAFMCEGKFHEIFDGIGEMIRDVLKLLK